MLDTEAYTYICSYIKYYIYIYGHTHLEEIVDRGINQQEHPEIQQVPTHSLAAGNRQAGTRGAGHQLLGTALGTGGQQAELGPAMRPGSNDGQQCMGSKSRTQTWEPGEGSALCSVVTSTPGIVLWIAKRHQQNCNKFMGGCQVINAEALALRAEAVGPQLVHLWEEMALGTPNSMCGTDRNGLRRCGLHGGSLIRDSPRMEPRPRDIVLTPVLGVSNPDW